MKITMNLLPDKYIGMKRDYFSMIIFVTLLALSLTFHMIWGFFLSKERKVVTEKIYMDKRKSEMTALEKDIKKEKQQINRLKSKNREEAIPQEELVKVADKIDFINTFLGEKSLSWFEFFNELEELSPEHIVIKTLEQLNQAQEPEFMMQAEARGHNEVNHFWTNMEDSVNFINIQLLSENELKKESGLPYTAFEMKFKYSPVVSIFLKPRKIIKPTGTTQKFTIMGIDLNQKEKVLPRKWGKWELVSKGKEIGYLLENMPGVFKAQQKGKGELRVVSPDGKLEAIAEIEVEE